MSHYFSKHQTKESNPQIVEYTYKNKHFKFETDTGVFSKDHVDNATNLLLNNVSIVNNQNVLDLGCGYGVIGIALASYYNIDLTMIDVNERAINLAKKNAKEYQITAKILVSDGFEKINQTFNHIVSNPPIRIGKEKLYQLFLNAKSHLKPQGILWLVIHKKHGALSAIKYLNTLFDVKVVAKDKGFHVLACQNTLTI